jgi:flagellar biosynthesis protein FlhG
MAATQFLNLSVNYMGYILKDHFVEQAVRIRKPFYQLYPDSPAAECIRKLVHALLGTPAGKSLNPNPPRGLKAFFFRLRRGHFAKR